MLTLDRAECAGGQALSASSTARHVGRPSTPTDQAWIESLIGIIKAEWPHQLAITDPATLRAELDIVQVKYNSVGLSLGVGYVSPNDEHEGRGEAIRQAALAVGKHAQP